MLTPEQAQDIADGLIELARKGGASAADAMLVAPTSAKELRAAEAARSARDDAGTGSDPLAEVVTSGTGTDADAGDYLNTPE